MQNYDYARKLNNRKSGVVVERKKRNIIDSIISKGYQGDFSSSIFTILVGSICIFTAGLIIGLQLNEQERVENNELLSLRNVSNTRQADTSSIRNNRSSSSNLLSPPRKGQKNYLIRAYNDTDEEFLISLGQEILDREPSLANRIFRTSSGDLYVGYLYSESEVKRWLNRIKKIEAFSDLNNDDIRVFDL